MDGRWPQNLVGNHEAIIIDTETYSFEDKNPMNNLGLRTIQFRALNDKGKGHYVI